MNALEGWRTEALFKFLEFMKGKSQAQSRQEDSSF